MSPLNNFGTDEHNAHVQPDGTYHYHGDPKAMYFQDCESQGQESPVIGFAADGFPVYGPCFSDPDDGVVRKVRSSFVLKSGTRQFVSPYTTPVAGNGAVSSNNYNGQFTGDYEYQANSGDLDECNGMTLNGQYGYYITDRYPWTMACFKGTPDSSFSKTGQALINSMHSH
ncbi:MAG: YHYH protein [Endozoicomonas sp.]|uniref:YHYH protein n=1 Tax=Endozoicomonas sp. TaxID=1892382 RepID=UPI003D9BA6AB